MSVYISMYACPQSVNHSHTVNFFKCGKKQTEKTMLFLSSGFQERHIYESKWKLIVL